MTSTSDISQAIGQKTMALALGVGPTAVNNAVARGYFPASWFLVVSRLAEDAGMECHPDLFRMKIVCAKRGAA